MAGGIGSEREEAVEDLTANKATPVIGQLEFCFYVLFIVYIFLYKGILFLLRPKKKYKVEKLPTFHLSTNFRITRGLFSAKKTQG